MRETGHDNRISGGDSSSLPWRCGSARDRPARGERVYGRRFGVGIDVGTDVDVDDDGIGIGVVGPVWLDVTDVIDDVIDDGTGDEGG
jgi:hypothetical protein